jgi:hypothetical protein
LLVAAPGLCQSPADLQGIWTNATVVPLERPANLKGKEFFTDAEAAENAKKVLGISSWERLGSQADVHYNMSQYGLDLSQVKVAASRRTSLIVGPDGRVPPLTAEAQKRQAERAARNRGHQFDGPENRPLQERCLIYSTEGPPMMPSAYNSNLQIVQGPGYVAIVQEMIHSTRIIPTDGSPHLSPHIRQWLGDSRGRWEGNTLIVDVVDFGEETWFDRAGNYHSDALHVVERYTPISPYHLRYEVTIEDPKVFSRPWNLSAILYRRIDPHVELLEYECYAYQLENEFTKK